MPYVHLTPYDGQDLDETLLDQFAENSRYVHAAVRVLQLHNGHIGDMRWPADIKIDDTVHFPAARGPAWDYPGTPPPLSYVFPPAVYPNIRVDGLADGIHTLALVNAGRTYRVRWIKTAEISFLTLWLNFQNGDLHAVTINLLGHAEEQATWT